MAGIAAAHLDTLETLFASIRPGPGHRLDSIEPIQTLLHGDGSLADAVSNICGARKRAVRAIAFDKSDSANWALGWHQDRVISVKERHDVQGFGPWTRKQGLPHVQPPFALLEQMVTIRIHLDRVDRENAPLKIAKGSHLFGPVAEHEVDQIVASSDIVECLAMPGDAWLYSTPILHASERAQPGRRRRVLQVDFSASQLPKPLEWAL